MNVLVVVDVQRDFFDPSGALYVDGSEVLPEKIAQLAGNYDAVIFTLDWHPSDHCSFTSQGGIWPSHCVAFTQGAGLPDCFAEILRSGKAKGVRFGTINRICYYLDCDVGDILKFDGELDEGDCDET